MKIHNGKINKIDEDQTIESRLFIYKDCIPKIQICVLKDEYK